MIRKYYDEFIKLPLDKMAQAIADITFAFEETRVPKKHYKKCLEEELVEMMNNEPNLEVTLLKPYYDLIGSLLKENKKYFIKALMLHEKGIKYSSLDAIQVQALFLTYDYIEDNKIKNILDKDIIEVFDNYVKNAETPKCREEVN